MLGLITVISIFIFIIIVAARLDHIEKKEFKSKVNNKKEN